LRFSNRFVFIREIDPEMNVHETFIPALITQPLIENAIWHGLLPLAGQRDPQLTLKIERNETFLVISIMDNGVGRTEPVVVQREEEDMRESKGTLLIRKRIEHLNRLYGLSGGRMQFIDLADEQGNPAGSTVELIFPLELLKQLYNERNQEHHH
jgi:LytS/YehU family sensor histidine kinase